MRVIIKVKNYAIYKKVWKIGMTTLHWKRIAASTVHVMYHFGMTCRGDKKYLIIIEPSKRHGIYRFKPCKFNEFYALWREGEGMRKKRVGVLCKMGFDQLFPDIKMNTRYNITVKEV